MFNSLIIKNNFNALTKQEKKVANFALEKEFELINMSITDIANQTNTSISSVNRTFKKMGFSGFKYYKMYLFSYLKSRKDTSNELSFQEHHLIQSIKNTFISIDQKQEIEKIINLFIKNKKSITFLAEGFNIFVSKIFASKLMKIGFDINFFDETLYSGALEKNVLVIFSTKMNNHSLSKKINICKKMNPNIEIVVITINQSIKSNYNFDYVLCGDLIENFRMNSKELPSDSIVIMMIICNYVFDKIYEINKDKNDELIEKIKW